MGLLQRALCDVVDLFYQIVIWGRGQTRSLTERSFLYLLLQEGLSVSRNTGQRSVEGRLEPGRGQFLGVMQKPVSAPTPTPAGHWEFGLENFRMRGAPTKLRDSGSADC